MSQLLADKVPAERPRFTPLQGQYLAFIHAYSRIFKQPPAEADMRRHFNVTAPSVHQMVAREKRCEARKSGDFGEYEVLKIAR